MGGCTAGDSQSHVKSEAEANHFQVVLLFADLTFGVAVKKGWKATRSYVEKLCWGIVKTGTIVLEIDGFTLDVHALGHILSIHDQPFSDTIIRGGGTSKLWKT